MAQAREEPFEPEPVSFTPPPAAAKPPHGLVASVLLAGIGAYQAQGRQVSVDRCPFALSCSRFAAREVERSGVWFGLFAFVDRFLFRENAEARAHYPLVETPRGAKLSDDAPADR